MHGICIFSQKELEVMHLLCRQHAIKLIAAELHVSECTINIHLKHIYEKLSVSNKQELIACLHDAGFDMSKNIIASPSCNTSYTNQPSVTHNSVAVAYKK